MVQKVDEEKVKTLLRQGYNPADIAKNHFKEIRIDPADERGITRQNINQIKREAEKEGESFPKTKVGRPVKVATKPQPELELDQATEILVKKFEDASKVPSLEEENWQLKKRLAKTEVALRLTEEELGKYKDKALRLRRAQQQRPEYGD